MNYFSFFGKNGTEDHNIDDKTPAGSINLLDDTLLESPNSATNSNMSTVFSSGWVFYSVVSYLSSENIFRCLVQKSIMFIII